MTDTAQSGCVSLFSPDYLADRWRRNLRGENPSAAPIIVDGPLTSEDAMAAHPDDLLDQVLHDNGKCGCCAK